MPNFTPSDDSKPKSKKSKLQQWSKNLKALLQGEFFWKTLSLHLILTGLFFFYFNLSNESFSQVALITGFSFLSFLISLRVYFNFKNELKHIAKQLRAMHFDQGTKKIYTQMPEEFALLTKTSNRVVRNLKSRLQIVSAEQNQLEIILSSMVDGVVALDKKQQVLHINLAAKSFFQMDENSKVLGKKFWQLIRYPQVNQVIDAVFDSRQSEQGEFVLAHASGEIVANLLATSIIDSDGDFIGAVLVIQDVSRQKQFEKVRRDFVANASHDLKTPIAAINAMVETMQDDADMPADIRMSFIEKIQRQTQRLLTLVHQLLDLSEAESLNPEDMPSFDSFNVCSLCEILALDLMPLAEKKDLKFNYLRPKTDIMMSGDRDGIEQVIQNLLANAIKYTAQGEIELSLQQEPNKTIIRVSDTGDGISEHDQTRIFERFYRVDPSRTSGNSAKSGNGLGLSIVKHIVERHGGTVSVTSRLGQGSEFTVELPA